VADHPPSPLAGKRVVVTRAESQSATLTAALRAKGAEVVPLPLIRIAPPQDFTPLDSALCELTDFDWLIFTSQNAVTAVADRLAALQDSKETPASVIPSLPAQAGAARNLSSSSRSLRIAAVGKATAEAAQLSGFNVTHVGHGGTAPELVHEFASELRGKRILLPRSNRAAAALVVQLRDLDARITEVVAYRTVAVASVDSHTRESVSNADAILFFSPSAVNAFLALTKSGVLSSLRSDIAVGAVGPVTRFALHEAGLRCDFEASEPSVNGIVAAFTAYFERAKVSSVSGVNSR
jgi:uroporphyrinogen III methyltransferase / synthase